jgi:methyl-accepting chemotaxis protein
MKSITRKIIILSAGVMTVVAILLTTTFFILFSTSISKQITLLDSTMRESFDRSMRFEVETAQSMLEKIAKMRNDGRFTAAEAEALARDLLRDLRYDKGTGYFWADTTDGLNMVLLGNATEGTNRMNAVDANGYPLIKNIIANGLKEGGGYTDYWFPKAGETTPLPKRGYSLLSPSWGWIVGSGAYTNDIDVIVETKKAEAYATMRAALFSISVFALCAIAAAILISIAVGRRMAKPIKYAAEQTALFASGDLSQPFDPTFRKSRDETGLLLDSLDAMRKDLGVLLGGVINSSEAVAKGAYELQDTSIDVSTGASEQAASTEEISASIEEMTATIKQNADNATETERIARKAANDAAEGSRAVGEAMNAVKRIAEKIAVIEEIAGQTNLLALNAAIEAARAGEAGKGFSVVAGEIRKLAERSGSSAAEIRDISASTTSSAERAGKLLAGLAPDIGRTADLVAEISAATTEQRIGADQIAQAMTQLDTVVQKNAAAAEELTAAAQNLNEEAESMKQSISSFKI